MARRVERASLRDRRGGQAGGRGHRGGWRARCVCVCVCVCVYVWWAAGGGGGSAARQPAGRAGGRAASAASRGAARRCVCAGVCCTWWRRARPPVAVRISDHSTLTRVVAAARGGSSPAVATQTRASVGTVARWRAATAPSVPSAAPDLPCARRPCRSAEASRCGQVRGRRSPPYTRSDALRCGARRRASSRCTLSPSSRATAPPPPPRPARSPALCEAGSWCRARLPAVVSSDALRPWFPPRRVEREEEDTGYPAGRLSDSAGTRCRAASPPRPPRRGAPAPPEHRVRLYTACRASTKRSLPHAALALCFVPPAPCARAPGQRSRTRAAVNADAARACLPARRELSGTPHTHTRLHAASLMSLT